MKSRMSSSQQSNDTTAAQRQTLRELLEIASMVRELQQQVDIFAAAIASEVELTEEALPDIAAAFKETAGMESESESEKSTGKSPAQERYAFIQAMRGLPAAWPT